MVWVLFFCGFAFIVSSTNLCYPWSKFSLFRWSAIGFSVFCNNVNVMFWWRDWSSWNDCGSDMCSSFLIPFSSRSFRYPCSNCSIFWWSAVGFSLFLNVFFNLVNVIFRWWGWISSNDLGSVLLLFWICNFFKEPLLSVIEVCVVSLVNYWFFGVPQCILQQCQRAILMGRLKLTKWLWLWRVL